MGAEMDKNLRVFYARNSKVLSENLDKNSVEIDDGNNGDKMHITDSGDGGKYGMDDSGNVKGSVEEDGVAGIDDNDQKFSESGGSKNINVMGSNGDGNIGDSVREGDSVRAKESLLTQAQRLFDSENSRNIDKGIFDDSNTGDDKKNVGGDALSGDSNVDKTPVERGRERGRAGFSSNKW